MKEPSVNTGVKNRTCWWIWAPVDRLPRHEWGGRVFARRDDTPHARIASGPTLGRLPECVLFFKSYHYLSFQLHNASKETFYRHISGNLQNRRLKKCFVKEKVWIKLKSENCLKPTESMNCRSGGSSSPNLSISAFTHSTEAVSNLVNSAKKKSNLKFVKSLWKFKISGSEIKNLL